MKHLKRIIIFSGILSIYLIFATFIRSDLSPIHYDTKNIFLMDLVEIRVDLHYGLLLFLGATNLFLLWLISRQLFRNSFSFIPPVIYAISPWNSYLVNAGSFYVYLSFLLLLAFYGLLLIKSDRRFLGSLLFVVAVTAAMYSSFLLLLVLPVICMFLIFFKITPFISTKFLILLVTLLFPLLFLVYGNGLGFKNIMNNEIKIFEDPGLLNMVNSFQGAAKQHGFSQLAKLSENKYVFFSEYTLLKVIKQFIPSSVFTPQEKLLNFSFTPPMFFGFLIPFVFGLWSCLKISGLRKMLFLSTLLVIPSVLSKTIVDLNRLFIFMPVIILVTAFGLILLYEQRNKKKLAVFLSITIFLVILQIVITVSDIQVREKDRYIKYFGQNYEIGKQ